MLPIGGVDVEPEFGVAFLGTAGGKDELLAAFLGAAG